MIFYPRTTRYQSGSIIGDIASLNWYKYVYGTTTFNFPLPNCTTYCYGRIMEQYYQQGYDLSVRTASFNPYWWNSTGSHFGNASTWYNSSLNTWQKGGTAKLGAIACWDENGYGGHVAIVEKINGDGTVNLSESNYGGNMFDYVSNQRLIVNQYDVRVGSNFLGFIYIPLNYDGSGTTPILYRRGKWVKILKYGRASSFGSYPIASGIGWKRQILRVYSNRPYPIQVGDLKSGATTGFYKPEALKLL